MNISDLIVAKFEKGGRGPDRFDCYGLFREVQRRRGLILPNYITPDDLEARDAAILAGIEEGWQALPSPEPYCGVAIRIGGLVCHVAAMLDDGVRFLHASSQKGISIERIDSSMWSSRVAGFYRWGGACPG